jgi:hypothetical protein
MTKGRLSDSVTPQERDVPCFHRARLVHILSRRFIVTNRSAYLGGSSSRLWPVELVRVKTDVTFLFGQECASTEGSGSEGVFIDRHACIRLPSPLRSAESGTQLGALCPPVIDRTAHGPVGVRHIYSGRYESTATTPSLCQLSRLSFYHLETQDITVRGT